MQQGALVGMVALVTGSATGIGAAIATTLSQTINGAAASTMVILDQWQSFTMQSDNANWLIVMST